MGSDGISLRRTINPPDTAATRPSGKGGAGGETNSPDRYTSDYCKDVISVGLGCLERQLSQGNFDVARNCLESVIKELEEEPLWSLDASIADYFDQRVVNGLEERYGAMTFRKLKQVKPQHIIDCLPALGAATVKEIKRVFADNGVRWA